MKESKLKRIAILGSTGSIGTQALEVIAEHSDLLEATVLTAGRNASLLIEQAKRFLPNAVVIADENQYETVKDALGDLPVKVYTGADALCGVVESGGRRGAHRDGRICWPSPDNGGYPCR